MSRGIDSQIEQNNTLYIVQLYTEVINMDCEEYEKRFGERLAKLRMDKGVSARDMSLSLGQSAGYINNIENKNNFPSMTVFFYICEYLGVTPMEFFDFDAQSPTRLAELTKHLKHLDREQLY